MVNINRNEENKKLNCVDLTVWILNAAFDECCGFSFVTYRILFGMFELWLFGIYNFFCVLFSLQI